MNGIITNMIKEEIGNLELAEWTIKETCLNGVTGKGIIIPPACALGVNIICSTSSGKLQYSRSPRQDIDTDNKTGTTLANWIDWEDGTVTVSTGRTSVACVTGIRLVSVTNTVILEAVASSN